MKRIWIIVFWIIVGINLQAQNMSKLHVLKTKADCVPYCSYNISNNSILYMGVVLKKNSSQIEKSIVAIKNIHSNNEYVIEEDLWRPPVGWVDSSKIILVDSSKDSITNKWNKNVYIKDVISKKRIDIFKNYDSLYFPSETMLIDGDRLIIRTVDTSYYKYNLNTKSSEELVTIRGIDIISYVYNAKRNILAFYSLNEVNDIVLRILSDDTIKNLHEFSKNTFWKNNTYHPLSINPDGNRLFFITTRGEKNVMLASISLNNNEIKEHMVFDEGVYCSSLSYYHEDKILICLGGLELKEGKIVHYGANSKMELGFDVSAKLFVLNL